MKQERYITDRKGKKVSVVLPIKKYKKIIEDLEELDDIRSYDKVKSAKQQFIVAEEAFKYIEGKRNS